MSTRSGKKPDEAMSNAERIGVYYRQNGVWRLTPVQRRRVRHKANSGRAAV